ncbi:PREDICTED: uncharacterized protein LOC105565170 [Vollenhovia emeryi]|uniref:uncharacterized protein LOC105565170 n=1 Tax=Vollenhovia emeryi TaxID=411798 RepID=UPI0005F54B45|nr:PREDICTED: uncharacterized protein LOC105565170 [Vollenhovia emeryi]
MSSRVPIVIRGGRLVTHNEHSKRKIQVRYLIEQRTMQDEQRDIVRSRNIRRVCNTSIPEIVGSLSDTMNTSRMPSRSRATMMPNDFAQSHKVPRKKIAVGKQSITPSQLTMDTQKKTEAECKDLELGLLYDEYLQAIMTDLIMKKKTEEKKRLLVTQLATVAQEIDRDTQKLVKVKTRERDMINLSLAQKEADAQLIAVTQCTNNETLKIVKDMSSKLQSLLEPLDVLRCNGIILPETQAEWEETREILIKCCNALKNITDVIGSKGETYCTINAGLKKFAETYDEIKDLQKKLEQVLCNLQVLMLKNASLSLSCNESG